MLVHVPCCTCARSMTHLLYFQIGSRSRARCIRVFITLSALAFLSIYMRDVGKVVCIAHNRVNEPYWHRWKCCLSERRTTHVSQPASRQLHYYLFMNASVIRVYAWNFLLSRLLHTRRSASASSVAKRSTSRIRHVRSLFLARHSSDANARNIKISDSSEARWVYACVCVRQDIRTETSFAS